MSVGVISTISLETEHFLTNVSVERSIKIGGTYFYQGELDNMPVISAKPGMDKVNAAIAAAIVLTTFEPDLVIFSGIAGSLDPALNIGNVVIGRHTLQHDYGYVDN